MPQTGSFTFVSLWSSDIVHSPHLANKAYGFVLFFVLIGTVGKAIRKMFV
tara:strand:- start:22051 stop:22200 length:150 start_codon:yes stop_codon:yes gene_type:complete